MSKKLTKEKFVSKAMKTHGVKLYYINYDEDVETKLDKILVEVCQNI